jgi:capsular polysaccharide transport system ATP-binding protein
MIQLSAIDKVYQTRSGPVQVLRGVNLTIAPGERVGILGRNGAGKSTLIRLISGAERPTRGAIARRMSVSWPLAFGGAFQASLTGYDNLRFICRIYDVDPEEKIGFVEEFSELGIYLREPIKSYSSGMRARLAFAISMVIEFDCFLIDEIIAVGDARFHEKCNYELFERRGDRAMIIVSHDPGYIRKHCTRAAVLAGGELHHSKSLDEAFDFYHEQSALAA